MVISKIFVTSDDIDLVMWDALCGGSERIFCICVAPQHIRQLNYGLISFAARMRCRKLYKCKYELWHNQIKSNRWTQFTLPLLRSHTLTHTHIHTHTIHARCITFTPYGWSASLMCIAAIVFMRLFFVRKLADWIVLLLERLFAKYPLCAHFTFRLFA